MEKIPRHIAIIMDGNRRWAKRKDLGEIEGHRQGVKVTKPVIQKAFDLGVEVVTFWAFSTKNFKRDVSFITNIMQVFRETLDKKEWFDEINDAGGELRIIGNPKSFPEDIRRKVQEYLNTNKPAKKRGVVNFALEYEGRDEIVRAVRKAAAAGENMAGMTAELFETYLDTAGQPDPDLVIRTGGDIRISGYLLWQIADAELYFTETLWPDFGPEALVEAIEEYGGRERRLGK